jgi:hypothetical protein
LPAVALDAIEATATRTKKTASAQPTVNRIVRWRSDGRGEKLSRRRSKSRLKPSRRAADVLDGPRDGGRDGLVRKFTCDKEEGMRETLAVDVRHTIDSRPTAKDAAAWGWKARYPIADHATRIVAYDGRTGAWVGEWVSPDGGYIRSFVKNERRCFVQEDMVEAEKRYPDDMRTVLRKSRLPVQWLD